MSSRIKGAAARTIAWKLKKRGEVELTCYQPKFIVDQVVANCRFMQQQPRFEPHFLVYALNNLCINHCSEKTAARAAARPLRPDDLHAYTDPAARTSA